MNLVESSFEIGDHTDRPVFLAFGEYPPVEASGVGATFNNTLSSHVFHFGIDVCFQGMGNWVLFWGARLTVSRYTDSPDEYTFDAVFSTDNIGATNELVYCSFQFIMVWVIDPHFVSASSVFDPLSGCWALVRW